MLRCGIHQTEVSLGRVYYHVVLWASSRRGFPWARCYLLLVNAEPAFSSGCDLDPCKPCSKSNRHDHRANIAIEAMTNPCPNQLPGNQLPLRQIAAIKHHQYSTHNQQVSGKRLTKTTRCFRQEVHLELPANDWQAALN